MEQKKFLLSVRAKFQISPNIHFNKIDNEIIILDMNQAEYYSLNPVASLIWEFLFNSKSEDWTSLEKVENKTFKNDTHEFIKDLLKCNLIQNI